MKTIKTSLGLLVLLTVVLMSGCVGTKMVSVWTEPGFSGPPVRNIVVVVLSQDETNRKIVEDIFTEALTKNGLRATRSYQALKNAEPTVDALKALVKEGGYDGVLAAWLVGKDEKTWYVPGTVTTGYGYYGGSFWGAYPSYYGAVYSPGYMATETIVRVETGIWTVEGEGKRVWAGVSESTDPTSVPTISREIAAEVIDKAHRSGVL